MRTVKAIGAALAMGILILDSRCAFSGASEGIELCVKTVIPTLFPFFVVSAILTSSLERLPSPLLKLFRLNPNAGGILLSGLLGGYPVGARSVSQAYQEHSISKEDAQRLLPICNQCGPAFIFGMTAGLFHGKGVCLIIWLIQIIGVAILAWLLPTVESLPLCKSSGTQISLPQAVRQSVAAIATVCGWIVLFRILYRFLERWFLWALPLPIKTAVCGLLELANGCVDLARIQSEELRFVLCVMMTSFGGICVSMQTLSVIHPDLSGKYYFPGKALQCGICTLLALIYLGRIPLGWTAMLLLALIGLIFVLRRKKTVAFSRKRMYNNTINDTRELLCCSEKR